MRGGNDINERWLAPLLQRWESVGRFLDRDRAQVLSWPIYPKQMPRRRTLRSEDQVFLHTHLLVHGVAARTSEAASGQRQILSIHYPGEFVDLEHAFGANYSAGLIAISDVTLACIDTNLIAAAAQTSAAIGQALSGDVLRDAAIMRERLKNVGYRDAKTRIAHLLSEIAYRSAGRAPENGQVISFPFSQEQIADALGLTAVHVNRSLATLRNAGMIDTTRGELLIHDFSALRKAACFDPAYLSPPRRL